MDKVVVLAAGAGTRMRKADATVELTREQQLLAERGVKGLIPIGRPFLDYVLTRVADAGFRQVCLVIGPRHDELRNYYSAVATRRLQICFAVQEQPLGTAHAVAAAEDFAGNEPFLVINSDNCYPVEAMRGLRESTECAVAGFDREGLVRGGNIPDERVAKFAILESDGCGYLKRVLEKPDPDTLHRMPEPVLVSMNCWRFATGDFHGLPSDRSVAARGIRDPGCGHVFNDTTRAAVSRLCVRRSGPGLVKPAGHRRLETASW